MIPTVTIAVEHDENLIDSIAWQATLTDEDGQLLATFQGASAYDVTLAAAPIIDRHVADVRRQAVRA